MRHVASLRSLFLMSLIALGVASWALAAEGPGHHMKKPSNYTLLQVMQHLAASQQQIQAGLLMNNRLMIEKGAAAIASHPMPKGGIRPYIKKNHAALKSTIKTMDRQVHQTAVTLADKAQSATMIELQALNNTMVTGCISCHDVFRD